jgi:predicted Zn-dependent protease
MRRVYRSMLRAIHVPVIALLLGSCSSIGKINLISEEEELQMGAQFAQQLEKELKFINEPETNAYIDRLGQSIAKASQRSNIPYHFFVVDSDEVNAFAVPGGYLYVNRGLIEAAANESELAGVMGHEIGHIVGRHSARQMSQQYGISIIAGLALGQNPNMLAELTAQILANGALMNYSREMESEADTYGVQELYDVGIDPNGLPSFFDKLRAMEEQAGAGGAGGIDKYFSSHPNTADRAANTRAQIAKLPPKDGLRKDSPEFQKIKLKFS